MRKYFIVLVIIFITNIAGAYFGGYKLVWFDMLHHFLGGFFVALFFSGYLKKQLVSGSKLGNMLIIVGVTMFVGVSWEFSEYIANQLFTVPIYHKYHVVINFMGDLEDTISDLFMDMLGSIIATSIFIKSEAKNQ